MGARKAYTESQNARIRAAVEQLVSRFGSQRRVADAIGMSQPNLSAFVLGRYGVGSSVARRIAEVLGMSEEELIGADSAPPPPVDPYPNRAPVVEFARAIGTPDGVVRMLLRASPRDGRDVPSAEWSRLLCAISEIDRGPFEMPAPPRRRRANK